MPRRCFAVETWLQSQIAEKMKPSLYGGCVHYQEKHVALFMNRSEPIDVSEALTYIKIPCSSVSTSKADRCFLLFIFLDE